MHRTDWRHGLLAAALSLTPLVAQAEEPKSAALAALTEDEQLFDSHLMATQAQCTVNCPPSNCFTTPGVSPSPYSNQSPGASPYAAPQMASPGSTFSPGNVGSLSAGQG